MSSMSRARARGIRVAIVTAATGVFGLLASPARATIRFLQAEAATVENGRIEATSTGYTGAGYVNPNDQIGSAVSWTVTVDAAQPVAAVLKVRYANGNNKKKSVPMDLRVNGALITPAPSFVSTGGWSTWRLAVKNLTLAPGTHVIRLSSSSGNGGPHIDRLDLDDGQTALTDWTSILVESTMARYPTASALGSWNYYKALFLRGVLALHQRTGDPRYFNYVRNWVDYHVNSSGVIDTPLDKLDNFMPGHLLLSLYAATGAEKYRIAARTIRLRFNKGSYPRLSDSALQHKQITPSQIWIDGVYMAIPFLVRYGGTFPETDEAITEPRDVNQEAIDQLRMYVEHTQDNSSGLMYHGFDESGAAPWANDLTNTSAEFWCRAMGWYGMAVIDVLEALPATYDGSLLIGKLQNLIAGLVQYQDPATGRWYQVVNKGSLNGNWLETSCGSMHTYVISKAVERGYVPSTYLPAAQKGLQGTLAKISLGSDGLTNLETICVGTAVGDLTYYLNRPRETNDFHGLGAFILMFEQMNK
jgi:unsaturated rhamnogalacturonyl hydrolase